MKASHLRTLILLACGLAAALPVLGQVEHDLDEGPDVMAARREWLFRQRAYPRDFIPPGERAKAVIELNRQLAERASLRTRGLVRPDASSGIWTLTGPNPTHNLPST